jgi:hypothetical protein
MRAEAAGQARHGSRVGSNPTLLNGSCFRQAYLAICRLPHGTEQGSVMEREHTYNTTATSWFPVLEYVLCAGKF